MKKNGFTLAEVLVAIGIVGVLAAVTIPSLVLSIGKNQTAPALMKVINTLESANAYGMREKGVETLEQLAVAVGVNTSTNYLSEILPNYTNMAKVGYSATSGPLFDKLKSRGTYGTKDGVVIMNLGRKTNGTASIKTSGNYFELLVDVNGSKLPNREGNDIFRLYVDTKGLVIPYGTIAFGNYTSGWKKWQTNCPTGKTVPKDPKTCAGAIVDNGGNILYNYESIK